LVAASEKVRAVLNPIGEYNRRLEQLIKEGLSNTDARKELEAKEPHLVLARDNQVVIQRRAQLLADARSVDRVKSEDNTFKGCSRVCHIASNTTLLACHCGRFLMAARPPRRAYKSLLSPWIPRFDPGIIK
jgi:hypothetical protein